MLFIFAVSILINEYRQNEKSIIMDNDMKLSGERCFTPDEIQKAMKNLGFDNEQIANVIKRLKQ